MINQFKTVGFTICQNHGGRLSCGGRLGMEPLKFHPALADLQHAPILPDHTKELDLSLSLPYL